MFGRKKKIPKIVYDVTQKEVRTWWDGRKLVPTSKKEQRILKAKILESDPKATIIDSKAKREKDLEWIDRIEEADAFLND